MLSRKVGATCIEDILKELHHLLNILLATFIFIEGLQLLLRQCYFIGTQALDLLPKYGASFIEREATTEVLLLRIKHDTELLHIYLRKVVAHVLHRAGDLEID